MTTRITIGITGVMAAVAGAYLLLHSPYAPAQTVSTLPIVNTVSVQGYQLLRERRISRTVSDLTYRVSVRNNGPALIVVTGNASTTATNVTFIDAGVTLGDIASGTPATSTDTFTIRQNRTRPFRINQLTWQFRAAPGEGVPPDPGPANNRTVAGIDSDSDGVRDDMERWIAANYPTSAQQRALALQVGAQVQRAIEFGRVSVDSAIEVTQLTVRVSECGLAQDPNRYRALRKLVQATYLNTRPRWEAYLEYQAHLSGKVVSAYSQLQGAAACDVNPATLPN